MCSGSKRPALHITKSFLESNGAIFAYIEIKSINELTRASLASVNDDFNVRSTAKLIEKEKNF